MASQDARDVFERIKAMTPADQLRLAAGMLDEVSRPQTDARTRKSLLGMAHSICDRVSGETALLALGDGL